MPMKKPIVVANVCQVHHTLIITWIIHRSKWSNVQHIPERPMISLQGQGQDIGYVLH